MSLSPLQLLIIFGIAVLLFGTKKLRNMGSDLGGAVKGFKDAVKDETANNTDKKHQVIDHEETQVNVDETTVKDNQKV